MSYTVTISSQADNDIRAIYEYIAFTLMSRIRYMPVDNYRVFYSVDENQKTVSILRVMYGKRDVKNNI